MALEKNNPLELLPQSLPHPPPSPPWAAPPAPGCAPSPRLRQLPQAAHGVFLPWGFGLGVRLQGLWKVRQHCPESGSCGKKHRGHSQQGLSETADTDMESPMATCQNCIYPGPGMQAALGGIQAPRLQPLGIPWGIPTAAVLEASARVLLPSPGDSRLSLAQKMKVPSGQS